MILIDRMFTLASKKNARLVERKRRRFLTHEDGREFFRKMKEEILGGFRFEVRNPVGSFTGRTEELRELHKLIQKVKV